MNEYSEECLLTFLEKQSQLLDEPVAETRKHFWKIVWRLLSIRLEK